MERVDSIKTHCGHLKFLEQTTKIILSWRLPEGVVHQSCSKYRTEASAYS